MVTIKSDMNIKKMAVEDVTAYRSLLYQLTPLWKETSDGSGTGINFQFSGVGEHQLEFAKSDALRDAIAKLPSATIRLQHGIQFQLPQPHLNLSIRQAVAMWPVVVQLMGMPQFHILLQGETYISPPEKKEEEAKADDSEPAPALAPVSTTAPAPDLRGPGEEILVFNGTIYEPGSSGYENLPDLFDEPLEGLRLGTRGYNALKEDNLYCAGLVFRHSEAALLRIPNFGRKSLNEVKEWSDGKTLKLGVSILGWRPKRQPWETDNVRGITINGEIATTWQVRFLDRRILDASNWQRGGELFYNKLTADHRQVDNMLVHRLLHTDKVEGWQPETTLNDVVLSNEQIGILSWRWLDAIPESDHHRFPNHLLDKKVGDTLGVPYREAEKHIFGSQIPASVTAFLEKHNLSFGATIVGWDKPT